jgi:hypothetical protein
MISGNSNPRPASRQLSPQHRVDGMAQLLRELHQLLESYAPTWHTEDLDTRKRFCRGAISYPSAPSFQNRRPTVQSWRTRRSPEGMRFAIAFDQCRLEQWLVAGAGLGVGPVHSLSVEGLRGVHLRSGCRCGGWPAPDLQSSSRTRPYTSRVPRDRDFECGKGNDLVHAVRAAAENHGTMKTVGAGRGCPLEAVQRGENTRLSPSRLRLTPD